MDIESVIGVISQILLILRKDRKRKMTRQEAAQFCRDELNKHELKDWGVRLNQDAKGHFLGMCSYRDKVIILNAHHIDIHPKIGRASCRETV